MESDFESGREKRHFVSSPCNKGSFFSVPWLINGFSVSLIFLLVILYFLPVRYEVNDDLGIINAVSGKYGFPPDTTVVFISQTLAYLLVYLYDLYPTIPWYGITIYLAAYLGVALVINVVLRNTRDDRLSLLFCAPALLICCSHCFCFITFTSASLILEFGVFLSLLEWFIRDKCPYARARLYGSFLAGCFLLAFLLRWRVVLCSLVFLMPIVAFVRMQGIKGTVRVAALLVLVVVLDRTLFMINTETPLHEAYLQYSNLRAQFHDTVKGAFHGDQTREAIEQAGWTVEDYSFFRLWNVYDEKLFNARTLRIFLQENSPRGKGELALALWSQFKGSFKDGYRSILLVLFTLLSILIYRIPKVRDYSFQDKVRSTAFVGIVLIGIVVLMCLRFVPRIYIPLFAYVIGVTVLLSNLTESSLPQRASVLRRTLTIVPLLLLLLTLALCSAQAKIRLTILESSKLEKEYIHTCLRLVEQKSPSQELLILMSPMSPGGLGHPLREYADHPTPRIFPSGTAINSPHYYSILSDMGLEGGREFLRWTTNLKGVLFVMFARGGQHNWRHKRLWESYFSRHIVPAQNASLVPVYDFRDSKGIGLVFYAMASQ